MVWLVLCGGSLRLCGTVGQCKSFLSAPDSRTAFVKASALLNYVLSIRNECNKRYTPNRWKEFDHLPLLSVWDLADTQEEVLFTGDALPGETVVNSKGVPILIIIPEDSEEDMGINKFEALDSKTKKKMDSFLKEDRPNVSSKRTELTKKNG